MLSDINSHLVELRRAFSNNKGLLLTRDSGIQEKVFPIFLGLDSQGTPSLKYRLVEASSDTVETPLSSITAVVIEPNLDVPSEISTTQEYWQSKFFSFSAANNTPNVSYAPDLSPQADESNQEVDLSNPNQQQKLSTEQQAQDQDPTPVNDVGPHLLNQSEPEENLLSHEAQIPYSYAELPSKKKKNKTIVISIVVTSVLVLGGTTVLAGGVFSGSSSIGDWMSGSPSSSEQEYEKWSEEARAWQVSDEYMKQVSRDNDKFLMSESLKLTDYDHFSWSWPLHSFDENEDYLDSSDKMPEGWEVEYSAENITEIPLLSMENDPKGIYDSLSYKSEQGDILAGTALLSKSKIKELGKTDDEVTRAIMVELTSSTKGIEPKLIKVYDSRLSAEEYVEFYEFTYTDTTGKEIHYAIRAFQNSGKVLFLANNVGWPTESLVDNGFTFSLFIFPAYPLDDDRQAD